MRKSYRDEIIAILQKVNRIKIDEEEKKDEEVLFRCAHAQQNLL